MNVKAFRTDLTRDIAINAKLDVAAYDHNTSGKVLIGSSSISLRKAVANIADKEDTVIAVELVGKKGEVAGRVAISMSVEAKVEEDLITIDAASWQAGSYLIINKIIGCDLVTGNFITTPTPSIKLSYTSAPAWTPETSIGTTSSHIWDHCDPVAFKLSDVTPAMLMNTDNKLTVELWENKKKAAQGEIRTRALTKAGSMVGSEQAIEVDLMTGSKPAGTVTLFLTVCAPDKELERRQALLAAPEAAGLLPDKPSVTNGVLLISYIKV
jgi:hypothetical protein